MAAESGKEVSARQEAAARTPVSPVSPNVDMSGRARVKRRLRAAPCLDLAIAQATGLDVFLDAVADQVASRLKD